MKTNNIFISLIFLFIFLFASNTAFSQSEKKAKGLFVDLDLSALIADGDFMGHAALASGYRFNEKMAAGIEVRTTSKFSCCNHFGMQGIGATYRHTNKWFLGKLTLGKVLNAGRTWDGFPTFEYETGGLYYSVSVAYRTRPGFLFGLSYTGVENAEFDYYEYDFNTDELILDGKRTVRFGTIGIMVGVAFPGRGRDSISKNY